jgi:hypothetical protein
MVRHMEEFEEKNHINTQYLNVKGYVHEKFKYLGVLVTSNSNLQAEIHQRMIRGNKCYHGLNKHISLIYKVSVNCIKP